MGRTSLIIETDILQTLKEERYAGWKTSVGAYMLAGKASLDNVAAHSLEKNISPPVSGRQKMLENYVTNFVK